MAGLFDLNLDTLGEGIRGLLEHPAFTRLRAQNQQQGLGDYAAQQGFGAEPPDALSRLGAVNWAIDASTPFGGTLGSPFTRLGAATQQRDQARYDATHQPTGIGAGAATVATIAQPGVQAAGGLTAGVLPWVDQTRQTFGDFMDPDVMLAIMTNESHGDPSAYNAAGDAWGLFQNQHLGDVPVAQQFQAARTLAQQKQAAIAQSYAQNGLNPDARTRARDFALAWGGHFDYGTGGPNPTSRDIGSGQTADQLSAIFLNNYDRIKAGQTQQQAPQPGAPQTGGGAGIDAIFGGRAPAVTQEFGHTDYTTANPDEYAWATAYGLDGRSHPGIDYGVPVGAPLYAPTGGTVRIAGGGGFYNSPETGGDPAHKGEVMIELPNGDQLILGHLSNINGVQVGQSVAAGQYLGLSGSDNGPHVHVEYRQRQADGSYRIVDPRTVLR